MRGTLTTGRSRQGIEVREVGIRVLGARGLLIDGDPRLPPSSTVWVELALEGAVIRPLCEVGPCAEGTTPLRYLHLFPRDRRTIEAHLHQPDRFAREAA